MARVTIEDCLEKMQSRFELVHLAVRRVLQLRAGSPLLVDSPKNKQVVLALREIAAGKVSRDNIRQLEDFKVLPKPFGGDSEEPSRLEVREILASETRYDPSLEYEDAEGFEYQETEEP